MAKIQLDKKQAVTRDSLEQRLKTHLSGSAHYRKRMNQVLAETHKNDSAFSYRTMKLMLEAESRDMHIFQIFDKDNFKVINFFRGKPEDERSECDFCHTSDKIGTGYSIEFGDSPANITQYDVGPDCLFAMTQAFSSSKGRAAQLKEELDRVKVEALANRHKAVGKALDEAFGGEITVDDLSLAMMEKLVRMRSRYDTEAKKFLVFLHGKRETQEEIRKEFRNKYAAHLGEAVNYLNSLPTEDLRKQVQNEIARTKGKDHAMGKLLKSGLLSEEDKKIVEQMFNTTNKLTPEQYARANILFRMYFPRNLLNSYGSLVFDVEKRHKEGAIPDEVFGRISHLVRDPRTKATGEECMLLRWADPEDTIKVRMRYNESLRDKMRDKYGIDPINSLRRRLVDFYEQDRATHAEAGGRAKKEKCVLNYKDYKLVQGLVLLSSSIANADVRANPANFHRLVTQALSMDQFEDMIHDLSVLARKNSYHAMRNASKASKNLEEDDYLKKDYVSLDRFLDATYLTDIEIGALSEKLGIEATGRTREPLSEEIALAMIDRVCNTYFKDGRFCEWQRTSRKELLSASRPNYQLIDKKLIPKVLKQYAKVAGAKELDDDTREALKQTTESGIVESMTGLNLIVKPYFGELRYVME